MNTPTTTSVIIIDDHPLFRKGVSQLIALNDQLHLIGEASSGEEGLELAPAVEPAKPAVKSKKGRKAAPDTVVPAAPAPAAPEKEAAAEDGAEDKAMTGKSLAEEDFVMYGALNLLKGALFWQSKMAEPTTPAATGVPTHAATAP